MARAGDRIITLSRRDPVSLSEALQRLLPYCENNPFKVADWLNNHHRWGDICLLGDRIPTARNSIPAILALEARIQDGNAELHVQVRSMLGWDHPYPKNWQFERDGFETAIASFECASVAESREPQGWQAEVVLRWLRKNYPPAGKTSRSKTFKALRDDMSKDPAVIIEIRQTGRAVPSDDVVGKVVKYLGRSD